MPTEAFVYDAIRTPRGRGKKTGSLHGTKPISLVVGLIDELRKRNPTLDLDRVSDLVLGVVTPIGDQGSDIAKTAAIAAGLPDTVGGVQLNRFCASGLEAVNIAAQKVRAGWDELVIGGGVESMSRVPMGSDGGAWAMDPATAYDTYFVPQGVGADLIATIEGFTREDVDAYALRSQQRAAKAWAGGYFANSVVPVVDQNGITVLDHDEHMRPESTVEGLGKLPASFAAIGDMGGFDAVALQKYHQVEKIDHVHTRRQLVGHRRRRRAGAVGSRAGRHGRWASTPRARIVATATTGADPTIMLTGPIPATEKLLARDRADRRRHRPVRAERGVRLGRAELPEGAEHPEREAQRQRRRDRHGPPARRHRRDDPRHDGRRAGAPRGPPRPGHPVHRRRHGRRDHHRARLRLQSDRKRHSMTEQNTIRWEQGRRRRSSC